MQKFLRSQKMHRYRNNKINQKGLQGIVPLNYQKIKHKAENPKDIYRKVLNYM